MRMLAAVFLALATLTASACADSYENARFGYHLTYPTGLFAPQPESDNGDGRHFKARNGGADIAVWGAFNALEQSPSDIADEVAHDCASSTQPTGWSRPRS
jgi:hypothetical protein